MKPHHLTIGSIGCFVLFSVAELEIYPFFLSFPIVIIKNPRGETNFHITTRAKNLKIMVIPRDPITLSEDNWGVQSPPKRKVFRFHETILSFGEPGSLGDRNL